MQRLVWIQNLTLGILFGILSGHLTAQDFNPKLWNEKLTKLLNNHPELVSWEEQVRIAHINQEIQGRLPDTKLGFAYRNYPARNRGNPIPDFRSREDFSPMTGREIFLSQEIPYPGKLTTEKKLAYYDFLTEREKYQIVRNGFIARYYNLLLESHFLEKEKEILKKLVQLQNSLLRISGSGFASGKTNSINYLNEENNLRKWKERSLGVESQLKEIQEQLPYYEEFLSRDEVRFMARSIHSYLDEAFQDFAREVQEHYQNQELSTPYLRSYQVNLQKLEEEEKKVKLNYIPDAEFFLAYMMRDSRFYRISQNPLNYGQVMPIEEYSGDMVSMGVTLKVPSWSLPATIQESKQIQSRKKKEYFEKLAYEKKFQTEVKSSVQKIQGLEERIRFYDQEILPNLKKSARISGLDSESQDTPLSSFNFAKEYYLASIEYLTLDKEKASTIVNLLELAGKLDPYSRNKNEENGR